MRIIADFVTGCYKVIRRTKRATPRSLITADSAAFSDRDRTIVGVDVRVADNADEGRFELFADGELAGSAYYRMEGDAIAFTHTEVDDAYEGQGLGSKLASSALDQARARGLSVLPYCPFIRGYIQRHDEYLDLVPPGERARFGL
jgi:uncharacterized protein